MEKNILENIITDIKILDGADYSETTGDNLYYACFKYGMMDMLDFAAKLLEDRADKILTKENLKTVGSTAKIITYVVLYNEIKEMKSLYSHDQAKKSKIGGLAYYEQRNAWQ